MEVAGTQPLATREKGVQIYQRKARLTDKGAMWGLSMRVDWECMRSGLKNLGYPFDDKTVAGDQRDEKAIVGVEGETEALQAVNKEHSGEQEQACCRDGEGRIRGGGGGNGSDD